MTVLPNTAKINDKGHLEIGGCDTVDLAVEFGTPLYVLDEETIRNRCQQYLSEFKNHYPNSRIIYACKALCTTAVLKIIESEGLGLDISSGGELYTALKAKCNPKNIYFHGNNKSPNELREGIEAGVGYFVVDNFQELQNLEGITHKTRIPVNLLLRINPGIEAHTHYYVTAGKIDSKFGIPLEQIEEAISRVRKMKLINFFGFHAHIGSQILEMKPFEEEAKLLFSLSKKFEVPEVDLGGGLGIAYREDVSPPSIATLAKTMTEVFKEKSFVKIIVEPGRSIVGTAGITLYRVGAIKDIPEVRKYLMLDGGMADNIRPMLYGAHYTAKVANRIKEEPFEKASLAGRFCESGDILIKDAHLPKVEVNDLIAIFCTGAYNYSMASNYNRVGRPAMVLVSGGNATLIVRRESYEDLVEQDVAL